MSNRFMSGNTLIRIMIKAPVLLAAAILWMPLSAAHAEGNAQAGEAKFYTCIGCHGIEDYSNVYPTFKVPKLGGQSAQYLELALKAYRDEQRSHPTMQGQAKSLSDEDIADISAYLAQPAQQQ